MGQSFKANKIIPWIATVWFITIFLFFLIIFHFITLVAVCLGARQWAYDYLNYFVLLALKLGGTKIKIDIPFTLTNDKPLIIVANHQSMFDIPIINWHFRKHQPKFIAKIELSKGIPAISLSLRKGAGLLINRSNPKESLKTLKKYGIEINNTNIAIAIFPEGTRARDGKMKPFKTAGLSTLLKAMPKAVVLPIAITNSWKVAVDNFRPYYPGITIKMTALNLLKPSDFDSNSDLISECEARIKKATSS